MAKAPLKAGETMVIDPQKEGQSVLDNSPDQKALRMLIERRHPLYKDTTAQWQFLEDTYNGGRAWFKDNIHRYLKEGDNEFKNRLDRAYRFNHTREVVDLLNKYLFKQNITRNVDDAPKSVQKFWKQSTTNGLAIGDFSRQISKKSSIFGRVAIVVDTNAPETIISQADEEKLGIRTYSYVVPPVDVLDYSFDECGALNWILLREFRRDDSDPLSSTGAEVEHFRLWTRKESLLLREDQSKAKVKKVIIESHVAHDLGMVPVVLADNIVSDDLYVTPALIDDIAYLDKAVANYLSNLDAIIQDQTFSQLAMPAQGLLPGDDNYNKLMEVGTNRIFLFDGEGGAVPQYISPDVKQANVLLDTINKIINEIYHTVGLAGERTKQDNALGIDNSSGVAKAYDFERVNALLAAKADSLEIVENKIVAIVAAWNNEQVDENTKLVSYPDNFDTRGLYDEFDIAARLMLIDAPDAVRQEQMGTVMDKLFPQIGKADREKMDQQLKSWPPKLVEGAEPDSDIQSVKKTQEKNQATAVASAK